MEIHQGHKNIRLPGSVITVGVFDGVHRGHMALINDVVSLAAKLGQTSSVVTFSQHPRHVLGDDSGMRLLTTTDEKISLIEKLGVAHLIILDFNHEFSKTSACDFVRNVLIEQVGAKHLVFGYDHRIGKDGEGDFNTIKNSCTPNDLSVILSPGVFEGSRPISSSAIRSALLDGNIDIANDFLGYSYSLQGEVISGKKLGRSLGFPTANIMPIDKLKLVPSNGVYAVEVLYKDKEHAGMLSIGTNPTVNPGSNIRSIEVHILDFSKEIYGEAITLRFRKKLREERKFKDIRELAAQMENDRLETIRLFS